METEAGLLRFRSRALRHPVVGHLPWLAILPCGQLLSLMTPLLFDVLGLKIKVWYIWDRARALQALAHL